MFPGRGQNCRSARPSGGAEPSPYFYAIIASLRFTVPSNSAATCLPCLWNNMLLLRATRVQTTGRIWPPTHSPTY